LEQAAVAIVVCDEQGRVIRAGHAARQYCDDSPLPRRFDDLFPLRTDAGVSLSLAPVLRGEALLAVDVTLDRPGRRLDFILTASPLVHDQRAAGCVVTLTDITARKESRRAQAALIDSEVRYRRLFESARDGILILDAETGILVDVNPFLVELLGFSREELLGRRIWDLGFFTDVVANEANFSRLQEKGYVRYDDLALESRSGRRIEVEFVSNVYLVDGHRVIQCNIRDISARKQADSRLAAQLAELERWQDVTLDREDRVQELKREVNDLCCRAGDPARYPSQDANPARPESAAPDECPAADRPKSERVERHDVERELRRNLERAERSRGAMLSMLEDQKQVEGALSEKAHFLSESQRVGRVGSWMWDMTGPISWSDELYGIYGVSRDTFSPTVESLIGLIHPDDRPAMQAWIAACAAGEKPGELEYRVIAPDGTTRFLMGRGDVVCTAGHGPIHMAGTAQDITDRRRAEEERARLESQLRQAQKMESVGRLAGGVAHDFNNMLGVILGHAELAIKQVHEALPLHADLTEIRDAANRAADLTRQLLAFARKQTVTPRVVDLNDAVAAVLKMLHRLIGEQIAIRWLPGKRLWPVKVDPAQIDQILTNLCVNARDAISGNGTITIETGITTIDKAYSVAHPGFAPGDYARLTVTDTGCGMEKDVLSHVFEPFFTTKTTGKGTGLGLAMVYGIVKQNGGFVSVETDLSQGTTFAIYLPRHQGTAAPERTEGMADQMPGGHETILIVEDEPAVLRLTRRMLEDQGYTVVAAGTPGEAMALAREHIGDFDLLMTDVIMPEMNGRTLTRNLLSLYPSLKRLFMSGYTADVIAQHGVLDEGVHFLQKPFSEERLAAAVRSALDALD
jgi:PAS domain S-box-containing protein